ncbi:uncharacterized protein TNCV_543941 [Trichonephila clavipes]|nr:uncharacterized protein TNCV_543941 [Trichonephila clavipes]
MLFQRLDEYELCINPFKCIFGVSKMSFLDYEITASGPKPVPEKVKVIKNFPDHKSATILRRFLEMVNFYHRFTPNCSKIQQSFTEILEGHKKNSTKPLL